MSESIRLTATLAASPRQVYEAWLDGETHGLMTGSRATVEPRVGGGFSAGDGYISGATRELVPNKRIVQSWRTTDFPEDAPDSLLDLTLESAKGGGTVLTLVHSEIPEGQAEKYEQGWRDYYFVPMTHYFEDMAVKLPVRAARPRKEKGAKVAAVRRVATKAKSAIKPRKSVRKAPAAKKAAKKAKPARKSARSAVKKAVSKVRTRAKKAVSRVRRKR